MQAMWYRTRYGYIYLMYNMPAISQATSLNFIRTSNGPGCEARSVLKDVV